ATYHKHQRHNRRELLELCGRKVQLQAESLHRCKLGSPAVHTTGGGHGWSQSDVYALSIPVVYSRLSAISATHHSIRQGHTNEVQDGRVAAINRRYRWQIDVRPIPFVLESVACTVDGSELVKVHWLRLHTLPPPPPSSIDPATDIQQQLSANTERCHQRAERVKYRRGGDAVDDADLYLPDQPSSKDLGELYIGEINCAVRLLLPQSPLDPSATSARSSATFWPRTPPAPVPVQEQTASQPRTPPTPPPSTSSPPPVPTGNATSPGTCLVTPTYTAPTPREHFLQKYGLHTTEALAVLLHNSFKRIVSDPPGRTTAHRTQPRPDHSSTHIFPDTPVMG
ncbi:hypothetical protein THAOC_22584, partial [Thalassiosira oceanica]